ncbi:MULTISPECIES: hypothetical protein [Streptomyces]|uniref:hypothetical protein n=1 Tax=Streptomyces TaxID=1883 RepID=UPI00068FA5A8|nr:MULTISPECIES: hypothetical protein [unclassified Streptomyces]
MCDEIAAAASRYIHRKVGCGKASATDQGWQNRAWDLYYLVPEVRFAASHVGNAMSGAVLFRQPPRRGRLDRTRPETPASEIVAQIAGGPDGRSKLFGSMGKHLTVPSEGWIVIRPNSEVLSADAPEDGRLAGPVRPRGPPAVRQAYRRGRR